MIYQKEARKFIEDHLKLIVGILALVVIVLLLFWLLPKEDQKDKIRDVERTIDTVIVNLNAVTFLTVNLMREKIIEDSTMVFKLVFNDPDYEEINTVIVQSYYPLIDKYGQEIDEMIMKLTLKRETFNKINFENIYYEDLLEVLDGVLISPSLTK